MKNNLQIGFVLEIFWLTVFVAAFIKSIADTFRYGISESYEFFILSALALLLYFLRRNLRKRNSQN